MLRPILACLLLSAAPFWEARPPAQWTADELQEFFRVSPWAQPALGPQPGDDPIVYLATAAPVREAEAELARRAAARDPSAEALSENDEYLEFLRENLGKVIVLAVPISGTALDDPREAAAMERRCVLKIGRRKYKMTGHFPPAASDPYLRLVFPRAVTESDRRLAFDLYLPGNATPYRTVEFRVRSLMYKGRPEM